MKQVGKQGEQFEGNIVSRGLVGGHDGEKDVEKERIRNAGDVW